MIVIDYKEENVAKQKGNLILLKRYEGDENDSHLKYMIPFLKGNLFFYSFLFFYFSLEIAKKEYTDIRKEIEKYGSENTALNFYKENKKYNALVPKELR